MATKEQLIACRASYKDRGCQLIELTHLNGCKSGIANPAAIKVLMDALIGELDRQIAAL